MFFLPKKLKLVIGALMLMHFAWKAGMKDKELDIAGEDPCLVNVNGVMKPMPRSVCKIIATGKGLLGTGETIV